MSRKKGTVQRQSWEVDFIRLELSLTHKEALKKWDINRVETVDILTRLCSDGYKLSVWGDTLRGSTGASITEKDASASGHKRCLSAHGPDMLGAMKALAFKHAFMLDGNWDNARVAENDDDFYA